LALLSAQSFCGVKALAGGGAQLVRRRQPDLKIRKDKSAKQNDCCRSAGSILFTPAARGFPQRYGAHLGASARRAASRVGRCPYRKTPAGGCKKIP